MSPRISTLLWFLKRPHLYPQLLRELSRQARPSALDATQDESREWCASRAIDTREAVTRLTGAATTETIRKRYADVFAVAERRAEECPVKMGGPGALDLIHALAEHAGAHHVIETGVAFGWSSLALLLSLQHRDGARLVSTDMPYPNRNNERYVGCVVPDELRSRWKIVRNADREALPGALAELGGLDMCHYDSDKSYRGRTWAYPLLWKALRAGGVFVSDDIGDNVAFRDFCAAIDLDPVVVEFEGKYVGVLTKP